MPKSTDTCNKILNLMYRAAAWAPRIFAARLQAAIEAAA